MGGIQQAHNVVVADNLQQVPPSREASSEEWVEIVTAEMDRRFGDYEGERLYRLGISVDGYALAPPGIPIVLNPRSVLVLSVNVWDVALGAKLHEEPDQILIFDCASPESFLLGSGLTRTREEQMQILARNAARRVQQWMLENPERFSIDPDAAEVAVAEIEEIAEAAETPLDAASAATAEVDGEAGSPATCEPAAGDAAPEIPIVFAQIDDVAIDPTTNRPFSCDPTIPNLIPFVAHPSHTKICGRYYRWQLPLKIAHCRTIHKAQGLTAHHGVVFQPTDMSDGRGPFAMALEYVGLSRPKRLSNLWLRGCVLTPRHIDPPKHRAARRAVEAEYHRLATESYVVTDAPPANSD